MDGSYASSFVAEMIFFTKGKGLHKDYLTSFELALRDAATVKIVPLITFQEVIERCKQIEKGSFFPNM
jgi:arginine decarboxylase